jgi:hypothetical protein
MSKTHYFIITIILSISTLSYSYKMPLSITKKLASIIKTCGSSTFIKRLDQKLSQIDSKLEIDSIAASKLYQELWHTACLDTECNKQIPIHNMKNNYCWWATKPDAVYINEKVYDMLPFGAKRLACCELAILTKYRDDTLLRTAQVITLPILGIASYKSIKQFLNSSILQAIGTGIATVTLSTFAYEYLQINHNILIFDAAKAIKCYKCLDEVNNKNLSTFMQSFKKNHNLCSWHQN